MNCNRCNIRPRAVNDTYCAPCREAGREWLDAVVKIFERKNSSGDERAGLPCPSTQDSSGKGAHARELRST